MLQSPAPRLNFLDVSIVDPERRMAGTCWSRNRKEGSKQLFRFQDSVFAL